MAEGNLDAGLEQGLVAAASAGCPLQGEHAFRDISAAGVQMGLNATR